MRHLMPVFGGVDNTNRAPAVANERECCKMNADGFFALHSIVLKIGCLRADFENIYCAAVKLMSKITKPTASAVQK
jgi:hypothetical protein